MEACRLVLELNTKSSISKLKSAVNSAMRLADYFPCRLRFASGFDSTQSEICKLKSAMTTLHLTTEQLETGLDHIRQSPKDNGLVELIVRRPQTEERELLEEGEFTIAEGLVGDNWSVRGSSRTPDGGPHPDMQINIMNARAVALVAQEKERWSLAGDQLFIDMDLSKSNLPVGSRISIGSAIFEVTAPPHTGCQKFVSRFGLEAMKFVNSEVGRELCLRGINAKVVQSGTIRVGQLAKKMF